MLISVLEKTTRQKPQDPTGLTKDGLDDIRLQHSRVLKVDSRMETEKI